MAHSDDHYMALALREAQAAAAEDEVPVGAVVVHGDSIIARAHNRTECLHDVSAHAEMLALTAAEGQIGGKYLHDCTVFVTVEPCAMCAAALGWAQIARLVYGANDEKRGYTHYAPHVLHPQTTVTTGVASGEAQALMQTFFRNRRH